MWNRQLWLRPPDSTVDNGLCIHISGCLEQESAILALAALAQNTRVETFRLLVKNEPEGVPAGELARLIGTPQNTMSAHLSILARAELVVGERHSRSIIYRANLKTFQDLMMFMVQDCCGEGASDQ
jgi:ArsR family transcriptional regulator